MAFFPIFVSLGPCLVVGGGNVAARKVSVLREYGARVTVVAPEVSAEIAALADADADSAESAVQFFRRTFLEDDVSGMTLVVAATSDTDCNRAVASACRARHIPVNVVDVPELCDFYFPALVKRGDLVVGIGTGGKSPAFARNVRKQLDSLFPKEAGEQLERCGILRKELLAAGKNPAEDASYNEAAFFSLART